MRVLCDPELGFRALTVKQPYAGQIASGKKPIEFRSWSTDYRGDILITASANPTTQGPSACCICVVELYDVRITDEAEWFLRNPRPVRNVAVKGKLGLWTVPDALLARLQIEV